MTWGHMRELLTGGILALCGCGQANEDPALLARVGEVRIVADNLQSSVAKLAADAEAANSEIDYGAILQTLVDREVLLLEARIRGVDQHPPVLARLRRHESEGLVGEMLYRQVTARFSITPEEAQREYERGGWEEQIKSLEIFVSDERKAQLVVDGLAAGADFGDLGRLYSEDRRFKVPVGSPQAFTYSPKDAPRKVVEAVFGLPEGGVTGPIFISDGYVIAKVMERRKVRLEAVAQKVVKWLTRAKKEALRDIYYASLQQSYELDLNPEGMDLVVGALRDGRSAETLAAEQRRLPVYTYRGGAIDAEEALTTLEREARRWPSIDEGLAADKLRKVLRRRLVELDARSRGVDQSESFKQWLEGKKEDLMIGRLRTMVLDEQLTIAEADIQAHYEESKEHFRIPASARVLELLVEDPEQARALRQDIEAGVDMRSLIRQHSIRQDVEEGVFLVYEGQARFYGDAWLKAVMNPQLNELQGPIKTKGGYSLFKVLGRTARGYNTLESELVRKAVRREVRAAKERDIFNDFLESLQRKHAGQIDVFEENLARWEAESEKLRSAPIDGSSDTAGRTSRVDEAMDGEHALGGQ